MTAIDRSDPKNWPVMKCDDGAKRRVVECFWDTEFPVDNYPSRMPARACYGGKWFFGHLHYDDNDNPTFKRGPYC